MPPPPAAVSNRLEIRDGFTLIETLDDFRDAIQCDGQKIRMKPGVYRADKTDPPVIVTARQSNITQRQEHLFAVNGSHNYFDLRGVVFETPVSVQSTLSAAPHVADTWHINGSDNTFEGGYFRNVVDRPYPKYSVTECEFEVCGDNNTFLDCIFVLKGSIPYGYSDFYGKGEDIYGRLNKHSFMGIERARNTKLIGCKVFMQSFGHALHFHGADGVLVKNCLISGTLRPTNDIFNEKAGRAKDYGFDIMYRGRRPIPRDRMIPLAEDGIRSYDEVKNVKIMDTTVERMRGCVQLLCVGDTTLENVTVLEAGDFSFDISSGEKGKVVVKNCRTDTAYNPVFNLTRGDIPEDAFYEVTILDPPEGVEPAGRANLGVICGRNCTFILRNGTTKPLPDAVNLLVCGGKNGRRLEGCTIENHTTARLILSQYARNCVVTSVGPVEDHGVANHIIKLKP